MPVDRGDRLDLAGGRGEERLAGREQVVELVLALLDVELATISARVIDSRIPASIDGVRRPPSGETQKSVEVGASRTMPSGRTSSASSAPRACAIRVACMLAA